MDINEIKKTKKFNKKQLNYLEKNNLIIINKNEIEKFKSINYKIPINIIVDKICLYILSQIEEKIKIYKKQEIEIMIENIKKETKYYIEDLIEIIYGYEPEFKNTCYGKEDKEKIMKKIKNYKIWDLVCESNKHKILVNDDLILNKLKAKKIKKELELKNKNKKYIILERKII